MVASALSIWASAGHPSGRQELVLAARLDPGLKEKTKHISISTFLLALIFIHKVKILLQNSKIINEKIKSFFVQFDLKLHEEKIVF